MPCICSFPGCFVDPGISAPNGSLQRLTYERLISSEWKASRCLKRTLWELTAVVCRTGEDKKVRETPTSRAAAVTDVAMSQPSQAQIVQIIYKIHILTIGG